MLYSRCKCDAVKQDTVEKQQITGGLVLIYQVSGTAAVSLHSSCAPPQMILMKMLLGWASSLREHA